VRALDRQISTLYYERLLSSQDKAKAQLQDEAAHNIARVTSSATPMCWSF
jgi:predicted nuclease of restriction endonuclease-like (RecB) superfamily